MRHYGFDSVVVEKVYNYLDIIKTDIIFLRPRVRYKIFIC